MLGVFAHRVEVAFRAASRRVQRHQPGIVVVRSIHGPGAQPEDQPDDACAGIDLLVPNIGIEGETDAGDLREELLPVSLAGDPHYQQGHLLVPVEKSAVDPVSQGFLAHRAGIHLPHGVQQCLQSLLPGALVDAKDAFVLAGEGVAVRVFQKRAGTHDVGRLAEVVEHRHELVHRVIRESPLEDSRSGLVQAFEEGVRIALLLAEPPDAAANEKRIEDVRPDVERIVRLQQSVKPGIALPEDRAGQKHTQRLAPDQPDADHAIPDLQDIGEAEIAVDQPKHDLVARQDHSTQSLEGLLLHFRGTTAGARVVERLLCFAEDAPPEADPAIGSQAGPPARR